MKKLLFFITTLCFSFMSNAQETVIIDENFDNNEFGWYETNSDENEIAVKDGALYFKNKSDGSRWVWRALKGLNADEEDYTIELKLRQISGDKNYAMGIIHAMYSDNSAYRSFYITARGQFKVDHYWGKKSHIQVNYENTNH